MAIAHTWCLFLRAPFKNLKGFLREHWENWMQPFLFSFLFYSPSSLAWFFFSLTPAWITYSLQTKSYTHTVCYSKLSYSLTELAVAAIVNILNNVSYFLSNTEWKLFGEVSLVTPCSSQPWARRALLRFNSSFTWLNTSFRILIHFNNSPDIVSHSAQLFSEKVYTSNECTICAQKPNHFLTVGCCTGHKILPLDKIKQDKKNTRLKLQSMFKKQFLKDVVIVVV